MGPLLLPVSSRAVCDHVRWWFTFQTTKNPFAAGQKVPASSSGSPRAQTSPSAKLGEPGETDSRKGYRQQQQRKREPRREQQQRDPKRDLRRRAEGTLEQGSFPEMPGEIPPEQRHSCSPGRRSQEQRKEEKTGEESWWEGYVLVSLYFSLPESVLTDNKLIYYSSGQVFFFAMVVTGNFPVFTSVLELFHLLFSSSGEKGQKKSI